MTRIASAFGLAAIIFGVLTCASAADAQAARTWVSSTGSDSNPCTRAAPCATLAQANSATATFGEIDILNGGDFGPSALTLNIVKSITIASDDVGASGLTPPTTSATIFIGTGTGPTDVVLRGLDLSGVGTSGSAISYGLAQGVSLLIDHCKIRDYAQAPAIRFAPVGSATLVVRDTLIVNSGASTSGAVWIFALSGGDSGLVKARFERVQILNAIGNGIRVDTTQGGPNPIDLELHDVTVDSASGGSAIVAVSPPSGGPAASIVADNVTSSHNAGYGFRAVGGTSTVFLRRSTVESNTVGISASSGGQVFSYGDNGFAYNGSDGATPTPIGLK